MLWVHARYLISFYFYFFPILFSALLINFVCVVWTDILLRVEFVIVRLVYVYQVDPEYYIFLLNFFVEH